jgi:hypothetical protein
VVSDQLGAVDLAMASMSPRNIVLDAPLDLPAPVTAVVPDGVDDYGDWSAAAGTVVGTMPDTGANAGFAIAMWVRGTPASGAELISLSDTGSTAYFNPFGVVSGTQLRTFFFGYNAQLNNIVWEGYPWSNQWYCIVLVDTGGTFKLFINGAEQQPKYGATASYSTAPITFDRVWIARSAKTGSGYWNGGLYSLAVWDHAPGEADAEAFAAELYHSGVAAMDWREAERNGPPTHYLPFVDRGSTSPNYGTNGTPLLWKNTSDSLFVEDGP